MAAAERYDTLGRWIEEAGGNIHPCVEIYHDEITNGSLRVKSSPAGDGADCSVENGDAIVNLPLSKSLSYLNAISGHPAFAEVSAQLPTFRMPENTEPFPEAFLREIPPHVIGRFVLMQQYLLGSQSVWWPYIRTLPQPEQLASMLPAMWPNDDIEFLQGTNAYVAVQEIKSTLKKEFKQAMKLLPETCSFKYTRPLYLWAYAIYTSRSFRPSLIIPDSHELSLPCEIDDFSLLLPVYDIGNHSISAKTTWKTDRETQLCTLRCCQEYTAGQQVYNNYGLKTNAELLLGYGFILPETDDFHNDYVHIKTKPTGDDDLSGAHIVSLRPMDDPSTVVGKSRRLVSDDVQVMSVFSHIQDSLVTSLYEAITRAPGGDELEDVSMDDLMAGNMDEKVKDKIVQALGSKLSYDLDKLDEIEVPREGLSANQELAVRYRDQCRKVLENALGRLAGIT